MRSLLILLVALATLVGCTQRAQVLVLIDADPEVQMHREFAHLHVYVRTAEAITNSTEIGEDRVIDQPIQWPARVVLTPRGDNLFFTPSERYEVIVGAHRTDNGTQTLEENLRNASIVTTRARSGYLRGETRVLRLRLEAACINNLCDVGETCRGGTCRLVENIDPGLLPTLMTYNIDAGPADAPVPPSIDAGPADADVPSSTDAFGVDAWAPSPFEPNEIRPEARLEASSLFGQSVAISANGSVVAVAVPGLAQVRVYRNGMNEEIVDAGTPGQGTSMQVALNADGDVLAVGWPLLNVVHVFRRTGTLDAWSDAEPIMGSGGTARFGAAIALNAAGTLLAVGAPNDSTTEPNGGAVHVYAHAPLVMDSGWPLLATLTANVPRAGDTFGSAVALSDDGFTLAVGAPGEDGAGRGPTTPPSMAADFGATDSGAVYVFTSAALGSYALDAYLKTPANPRDTVNAGDRFGQAIALNARGTALLVGAPQEDAMGMGLDSGDIDEARPNSGAAYLFRFEATWRPARYLKPLRPEEGGRFGTGVALSDHPEWSVVGAPNEGAGAVYAYLPPEPRHSRRLLTPLSGAELGFSVAVDTRGNVIVAGAPATSGDRGAAFLFQ